MLLGLSGEDHPNPTHSPNCNAHPTKLDTEFVVALIQASTRLRLVYGIQLSTVTTITTGGWARAVSFSASWWLQ